MGVDGDKSTPTRNVKTRQISRPVSQWERDSKLPTNTFENNTSSAARRVLTSECVFCYSWKVLTSVFHVPSCFDECFYLLFLFFCHVLDDFVSMSHHVDRCVLCPSSFDEWAFVMSVMFWLVFSCPSCFWLSVVYWRVFFMSIMFWRVFFMSIIMFFHDVSAFFSCPVVFFRHWLRRVSVSFCPCPVLTKYQNMFSSCWTPHSSFRESRQGDTSYTIKSTTKLKKKVEKKCHFCDSYIKSQHSVFFSFFFFSSILAFFGVRRLGFRSAYSLWNDVCVFLTCVCVMLFRYFLASHLWFLKIWLSVLLMPDMTARGVRRRHS